MPETPPDNEPHVGLVQRILWPGLIFVLLGGQLLVMFVMVYLATSDGSFAIEPDYYQKGLHWDTTAAQLRENERLGWSADIEFGDEVSVAGERTVRCLLADKSGQPIKGAVVDLVAFSHARGTQRTSATLLPADSGVYQTTLRFPREGVWEFRLVATRGTETFTGVELHEVYPPGENEPWRR
jgi:nitrogen fixation protein FixH